MKIEKGTSMALSEAREKPALSRRLPGEVLTLEELAALPAYIGMKPQHDTVYDSCIVSLDTFFGLQGQGREFPNDMVMEILGPYWDLVYRLEFTGVSEVTLPGGRLFAASEYINAMKVVSVSGMNTMLTLNFVSHPEDQLSITFEKGLATRYFLEKPVDRLITP